jgi:methylenetetrahydrofolate reductase (NADPH)
MPITTISGMKRMAELAEGSRFPATLLKALNTAGNDAKAIRQAGVQYAINQCQELIDEGVSGLHLYTLNKSNATLTIANSLEF